MSNRYAEGARQAAQEAAARGRHLSLSYASLPADPPPPPATLRRFETDPGQAVLFYAVQLNEAESGFACVSGPHPTPKAADAAAAALAMSCGRLGLPRKHAVLMVVSGGVLDVEAARAVAR